MENNNNESLKIKLSKTFSGIKETLKNTGEAIKQGAEKVGTKVKQVGTKAKQAGAGFLLGTALLTGATITTGCAQINNPSMPEIPENPIEAPYEEEQTEQTPNIETEQETPSIDTPSVEPTPDEPEQEQEKEQKLPDINNGEPHDKTNDDYEVTFREYHSDPYSRIYNSGFTVHNFFGEKPDIKNIADIADYSSYGIRYLYEQLESFEKSLENRPDAQRYFDKFITKGKGYIITLAKQLQPLHQEQTLLQRQAQALPTLVDIMNNIITNGMYIMQDFADILPNNQEREIFGKVFDGFDAATSKYGAGKNFVTSPNMQDNYYKAEQDLYYYFRAKYPDFADDFRANDLLLITSNQIAGAFGHNIELPEGVTSKDMIGFLSIFSNSGTLRGGIESAIENGYNIDNSKRVIEPSKELNNYINSKYLNAEQDLQK